MSLKCSSRIARTFIRSLCRRHFLREIGNRMRRAHASNHVFALGVDQIFAVETFSPLAGSRVKATPVALVLPMFPNTIVWTLTAVPQSCGMPYFRR